MVKPSVVICLVSSVTSLEFFRLRSSSLALVSSHNASQSALAEFDNPSFDVVSKTPIQKTETAACLCPFGQFWHWRIHKCVNQGAWGYECGFFPGEHHHRACTDGLTCKATYKAEDTYSSYGKHYGTANSFPATCDRCEWP